MYIEDLWRGYFHVKYVANSFKPAHDAAVTSSHFAGLPEPVFVINNNTATNMGTKLLITLLAF